MGTVFDYLDWRGDLSFEQAPLNEVDCLLFSMIVYIDYRDIVPEGHEESGVSVMAAANRIRSRYPNFKKYPIGMLISHDVVKLLYRMKETRRFRNVEMRAFVNEIDKEKQSQFSAVTFLLEDGTALVTYRGTDETLVGWKEDLNMSFLPVVPSQESAVKYLQEAAAVHRTKELILTGHSKGGNLAVYAAVHSDESIRSRICEVYSHDGPGFSRYILDDPVYLEMRPIIHSIVPQSSLVGILLEHDESYTVVKSREKNGVMSHNGLSWEIMGSSFVYMDDISEESKHTDRTINQWIRDMTPEQREEFCESIYQVFSVEGVSTVSELMAKRQKWLAHSKTLDPKVRESVQRVFSLLISVYTQNMFGGIFRKKETQVKAAAEAQDALKASKKASALAAPKAPAAKASVAKAPATKAPAAKAPAAKAPAAKAPAAKAVAPTATAAGKGKAPTQNKEKK